MLPEFIHLCFSVCILPHRQDTGGMFIAVLTRTETLEACWKREQEQYQAWLKGTEKSQLSRLTYQDSGAFVSLVVST